MKRIAEQLLGDVTGIIGIEEMDRNYIKMCWMSKTFYPQVNITVETDFKKIKKQYIDICRGIIKTIDRDRKELQTITLFAITRQLMTAYYKTDSDIVRMQAMWFNDILEEIGIDLCLNERCIPIPNYLFLIGIFSLLMLYRLF